MIISAVKYSKLSERDKEQKTNINSGSLWVQISRNRSCLTLQGVQWHIIKPRERGSFSVTHFVSVLGVSQFVRSYWPLYFSHTILVLSPFLCRGVNLREIITRFGRVERDGWVCLPLQVFLGEFMFVLSRRCIAGVPSVLAEAEQIVLNCYFQNLKSVFFF